MASAPRGLGSKLGRDLLRGLQDSGLKTRTASDIADRCQGRDHRDRCTDFARHVAQRRCYRPFMVRHFVVANVESAIADQGKVSHQGGAIDNGLGCPLPEVRVTSRPATLASSRWASITRADAAACKGRARPRSTKRRSSLVPWTIAKHTTCLPTSSAKNTVSPVVRLRSATIGSATRRT